MMAYQSILAGLLIGLAVGALNFYLMRLFVSFALRNSGKALGAVIIIFSYVLRYFLIGMMLYWMMSRGEKTAALVALVVVGVMTMLLAAMQQRKNTKAG
ncbi:MAG: hypothetical protein WC299_09930 [Kiritimatiellia bacterium]